jgi:GTPase SAR1 family protein
MQDDSASDCVRILVVGEVGCGKSTLVNALCSTRKRKLQSCTTTIGCSVSVKLLPASRTFIEFRDVGGHDAYKDVRSVFYTDVNYNGVMLVYDLCNPRSCTGLPQWLQELNDNGIGVSNASSQEVGNINVVFMINARNEKQYLFS